MNLIVSLLVLLMTGLAHGFSSHDGTLYDRKGLRPLPEEFDFTALNQTLFSEAEVQSEELRRVKYYLINGEVRLARVLLQKLIRGEKTRYKPIVYRYAGLLAFIEGDYQEALDFFSRREIQEIPHFAKICTAKTLTLIILDRTGPLLEEWDKCLLQNAGKLDPLALRWIQTLVLLKSAPIKGITRVPFEKEKLSRLENDDLKIFLKLALYLNQEQLIAPELTDLTLEQLKDEDIRELAGAIYFRVGTFSSSFRFIDGLTSPNAENIKGNLYVLRQKFELAYAQHKLALEKKQNSQNALERLLPLSWILGDWKNGAAYAEQVLASPRTQINRLTILAAFLLQQGDTKELRRVLEGIQQRSRKGIRLEVTQIASYLALRENEPRALVREAGRSCAQNDLVNCWVLFQTGLWENFPLTIRRDEDIVHAPLWEKLASENIEEPLKEVVYINQLDIEELDDKLIQLIPQAP